MGLTERVDAALDAGRAPGMHGLVVLRDGQVVLERYGAGPDHRLDEPLGHVVFDRDTLHDLRSVSKSVVGLVYGIALREGLVPEVGAPLLASFPECSPAGREHLTIEHALTMTLGLEWNEDAPPTPARPTVRSPWSWPPDRHRYVLERPVVEEAGKRWHYCGGASALIGEIITRGAGAAARRVRRRPALRPARHHPVRVVQGRRRRHQGRVRAAAASGGPGRDRAARARRRPRHRAPLLDRGDPAPPGRPRRRHPLRLPVVPPRRPGPGHRQRRPAPPHRPGRPVGGGGDGRRVRPGAIERRSGPGRRPRPLTPRSGRRGPPRAAPRLRGGGPRWRCGRRPPLP
ncbi:serine hydrolase domain-containing protein [Nonomuraea salmonea]|uniref:serine hydrolase domain-containing protein n=1 Tax=Nonomuraea salmonea TaxID=46181 RepID=UPI0031E758ED